MYINVSLRNKQVFKHFFDFLYVLKINREINTIKIVLFMVNNENI